MYHRCRGYKPDAGWALAVLSLLARRLHQRQGGISGTLRRRSQPQAPLRVRGALFRHGGADGCPRPLHNAKGVAQPPTCPRAIHDDMFEKGFKKGRADDAISIKQLYRPLQVLRAQPVYGTEYALVGSMQRVSRPCWSVPHGTTLIPGFTNRLRQVACTLQHVGRFMLLRPNPLTLVLAFTSKLLRALFRA